MSAKPLSAMGRWRGFEGGMEITIPLFLTGGIWFFAYKQLSNLSAVRPFTTLELWAVLGGAVGLTAWAISRQLYMAGRRWPWTLVVSTTLMTLGVTYLVSTRVAKAFKINCEEVLGGRVTSLIPFDQGDTTLNQAAEGGMVCQYGAVEDNVYLIGTLFRPVWDGQISIALWIFLAVVCVFTALGMRTRRLMPTKISFKVMNLLRFAPASGSASAMGKEKPKDGNVVACKNPTLWGETCGQIYAAEKEWYPGEWCGRCRQPFTPAPRRFTLKIVSLFTGDVDVLNGLERVDTVSWPRGEPIAPDGRLSGQERWVHLDTMDFPDIITVAQMLALVHERLPKLVGSEDERVMVAARTAVARASRIACWIWRGKLSHRLTYARPNNDISLALGTQRLRDVIEDGSEELWLQLDVGLLPLELRTGFKKTFVEEGRPPELQNSKVDLWIPVSNPFQQKEEAGLWVPRVEGQAMRKWLSLDQIRAGYIKGITQPLPYLRYDKERMLQGETSKAPEGHDKVPDPGTLDISRYPFIESGMEPASQRPLGASVAEWDWMEWSQIELLRKECLVLE